MITRRHCLLLTGVALLVGAKGSAYAQNAPAAVEIDEYRLGPGDKIRIQVYNEPDLSGSFDLDGMGQFSMPLTGSIQAGGLRAVDLERSITQILAKGYLKNPQVSITIITYRPFYIYGEVRQPGSYAYVNGMRMVNAVVLAGGYTPRARRERLLVTRVVNGQKTEIDATEDMLVFPDDLIRVPERFF